MIDRWKIFELLYVEFVREEDWFEDVDEKVELQDDGTIAGGEHK